MFIRTPNVTKGLKVEIEQAPKGGEFVSPMDKLHKHDPNQKYNLNRCKLIVETGRRKVA